MAEPFFDRLRTYYTKVAAVLRSEADAASVFPNRTGPGGSSVSVALSTANLARPATLVFDSGSSDLGSVLIGATGVATVFTVRNTSDTTAGLLSVSVSGSEFVVTSGGPDE